MKFKDDPQVNSAIVNAISNIITGYTSFEKIRNYTNLDQFVTDPNTISLNAVAIPKGKDYINAMRQVPPFGDDRPIPVDASKTLNRGLEATVLEYSLETQATVGVSDTCVMTISLTPCTNTIRFEPTDLYRLKYHEALCICSFCVNPHVCVSPFDDSFDKSSTNPNWLDDFNSKLGFTGDRAIVTIDGTYPGPDCNLYTDIDRKESIPTCSSKVYYWGDLEKELNNKVEMMFRPFYNLIIRSLGIDDLVCGDIGCCGFFMGKSINPEHAKNNIVPQIFDFSVVGALGRA